jgi:hypothetical protein
MERAGGTTRNPTSFFWKKSMPSIYAYLNKAVRGAEGSGITRGEFLVREPVAYDALFGDYSAWFWMNGSKRSPHPKMRLFLN